MVRRRPIPPATDHADKGTSDHFVLVPAPLPIELLSCDCESYVFLRDHRSQKVSLTRLRKVFEKIRS